MTTQLQQARAGIVTPAMQYVAQVEGLPAETVRAEVAAGRLVIPANTLHLQTNLKPGGIGRALTTKVNANIGTSSVRCSVETEIEKMDAALSVGADTIMDLCTGGDLDAVRRELLAHCPVPFGTVPIYQVIAGRNVEDINPATRCWRRSKSRPPRAWTSSPSTRACCASTWPAGLKRTRRRHRQPGRRPAGQVDDPPRPPEPAVRDVRRAFAICRPVRRVRISLGDGLRPGCLADATDAAQFAELRRWASWRQRAVERACRSMVEGPGHVPFDQIEYNMALQPGASATVRPSTCSGPLVTDVRPGYDHITSAIGAGHGRASTGPRSCATSHPGSTWDCPPRGRSARVSSRRRSPPTEAMSRGALKAPSTATAA